MKSTFLSVALLLMSLIPALNSSAQIIVTPAGSAQQLVQKLVGEGISISNVTYTGDPNLLMAGHFKNTGGTNINIDSGIVLTSGTAKTSGFDEGVDGPASGLASTDQGLDGDATLATAVGLPLDEMFDAFVLEFDFVPLGDTIRFNYVFSSEEYTPAFVCGFNDAFGFFISGPGITGVKNIALVPNTTLPVSIFNVNNVPAFPPCPNNIAYYVDNDVNPFFSHDGHTTVLTAMSQVQPCQTYHLKLVISDNADGVWDSGVFLEAKSLSSNAVKLLNNTQTANNGDSYLVEGCVPGSFTIRRLVAAPFPLTVNLQYTGTATNGVDMQTMPTTVTIPANETDVLVDIFPIIDNTPEGIEFVKVFSLAACASSTALPIDSTIFQIRDYDTLGIIPDTSIICRNAPVQLTATAGYTTYQWTPAAGLSNPGIRDPIATPVGTSTMYYATANIGTCNGMDSAYIEWKVPELVSTSPVNCQGGNTGQIVVSGGSEWASPLQYSIDGGPLQNTGTFNNLPIGPHTIILNDGSCVDSIIVNVVQAYPDLLIPIAPLTTPGNCTGGLSGTITINPTGGLPPYQYSSDGTTFQSSNILAVAAGTYNVVVKDANGCTTTTSVVVGFVNSVELLTGTDPVICESKSTTLPATATATSVTWTPQATLSNPNILNPVANPTVTTTYYITATTGVCSKMDSVTVIVNPAPRPDAGADKSICFGGTTALNAVTNASEYEWTPSTFLSSTSIRNPDVVRPSSNITYLLKVTDANGCKSLVYDTVKVNVTSAVRMFAGNDTIVAMNQPVQLTGMQMGANTVIAYTWSPAYGLNNPNVHNPIATLDRDMWYKFTGRTADNCEGTDSILVKVYKGPEIYVPTVFTPNGDGTNDILRAWAIGMKEYRYFRVFNRWGQLVYSNPDFNKGWDGKIKGAVQGPGTYVWMAEAVDFRGNTITRKGTTTILQ